MTREEAIKSFMCSNEQAKLRLEVEKMRMDSGEIKELEFYIERDEMARQALEQEPTVTSTDEPMTMVFPTIICDDTVSIRNDVLKCRVGKLVVYNVEWLKKNWQMEMDIVCGVKPCDDAISRDALIAKLTELIKTERSTIEIKAKLIPMIQNMPSVSTTKNIVNHGTMNITL